MRWKVAGTGLQEPTRGGDGKLRTLPSRTKQETQARPGFRSKLQATSRSDVKTGAVRKCHAPGRSQNKIERPQSSRSVRRIEKDRAPEKLHIDRIGWHEQVRVQAAGFADPHKERRLSRAGTLEHAARQVGEQTHAACNPPFSGAGLPRAWRCGATPVTRCDIVHPQRTGWQATSGARARRVFTFSGVGLPRAWRCGTTPVTRFIIVHPQRTGWQATRGARVRIGFTVPIPPDLAQHLVQGAPAQTAGPGTRRLGEQDIDRCPARGHDRKIDAARARQPRRPRLDGADALQKRPGRSTLLHPAASEGCFVLHLFGYCTPKQKPVNIPKLTNALRARFSGLRAGDIRPFSKTTRSPVRDNVGRRSQAC
jgi:hypothetical protein